ncbi:hypothetical protein N2152v2_004006 [Parachlorella kessleri]
MAQQTTKTALISGATGSTGYYLAQHLLKCGDWEVHTVSRRKLDGISGGDKLKEHHVDLLQGSEQLTQALKETGGSITHVYHCAYLTTGDAVKDCDINLKMFKALVEGGEAAGCKLQHVYCMEGTKWYGVHFRPGGIDNLKTPHKEDDPRHMPPNFYYDLEDYMKERVSGGASWSWSALRPNPVCGFSTGSFMNLVVSLGVYAAICKELGCAFSFPGSSAGYHVLTEVCDADLLAKAMVHLSTQPQCANQAFNISNGDVFRWCQVWPHIAEFFGLPVAEPMHLSLTDVMKDKGPVWDSIVKKHNLEAAPYDQLATWPFLDVVFSQQTDFFSDVNKLRRTGFQDMSIDSTEMFLELLAHLREIRIIP